MKSKILILLACLACAFGLRAQTDTVAYPDPWYLYRPLPTAPAAQAGSFYQWNYCDHYLQSFYTDIPVNIYGVACIIDTLRTNKDNPDSVYFPMLYRYEGSGRMNNLPCRFFSIEDSASFLGYTRQCKFKFEYASLGSNLASGDTILDCYEFYFDRPYRSDTINPFDGYQDSVYVGRYVKCVPVFSVWERRMDLSNGGSGYAAQGSLHGENAHSNHFAFHSGGVFNYSWGPFFPIVRLRCVQPELRLWRNWYDTTVVTWRTVEAPDGYEVSLGDYGSDPDSGAIVALSDTCHSYAFGRLLSNRHYSVWVRKGCYYGNFDTVAWSPWSEPVSFYGPTTPPDPDDTTAIDGAPTPRAFTLSPNPASGTVSVSSDFTLQRIDFYNTAGALVLSLPASGNSIEVSLEGLLPGTYLVTVTTAAGTATRKLAVAGQTHQK